MKKKEKADPMACLVRNSNTKRAEYNWKFGLLAAIITSIASTLIYTLAGRLIGGEYVFLQSDLYVQYVETIRLFLKSLFGQGEVTYSFSFSMGSSTLPIYAFWCMSPWNLIYLLITDLNTATFLVVTGKMAMAAWLFQTYLSRSLHRTGISTVTFSILYALCGYSVVFYYNIHTLDGIYILPLLMMALGTFVRKRKLVPLILVYTYSFLVMFYIGYILGIFSALVFLLLLWKQYGKQIKCYLGFVLQYILCVLTAAAISAAVLLPTALYLFRNQASDATAFTGLHVKVWDIYQNLFIGQMQTTEGIFPLIYCGIVVLFMVPLYFYNKENDKKDKVIAGILLTFLLLCSLWPQAYLMMHCFDAPDSCGFRFAYLYSFVLLSITAIEWEHIQEILFRRLALLAAVNGLVYYVVFLMQRNYLDPIYQSSSVMGLEINLIFLALFLLNVRYFLASKKKKAGQIIYLGLTVVEVILNGYLCNTAVSHTVGESKEVYELWNEEANCAMEQLPQDEFYRVHYINPISNNDAALFGYRGIGYFSTFENYALRNTMNTLGYMTSPRTVYDYGSTTVSRMLFNQKYSVRATDLRIEERGENPIVHCEEHTLALGYMVNEHLLDYTMQGDNPFENYNQMISSMTGMSINCFEPMTSQISYVEDNLSFQMNENGYLVQMEDATQPTGMLTFEIAPVQDAACYAYLSQPSSQKVTESARTLSETGDYGSLLTHSYLSAPHIIELGENDEGMDTVSILMTNTTVSSQTFQNAYFYYEDEQQIDKAYDALQDNQMEIISMKDTDIMARVIATENKKLLFTSIPYEDGWNVYVDGAQTAIMPVMQQTFLAVMLTPGEHTVEFVFKTPGQNCGLMITSGGIVVLLLCMGIDLRRKKHWKE